MALIFVFLMAISATAAPDTVFMQQVVLEKEGTFLEGQVAREAAAQKVSMTNTKVVAAVIGSMLGPVYTVPQLWMTKGDLVPPRNQLLLMDKSDEYKHGYISSYEETTRERKKMDRFWYGNGAWLLVFAMVGMATAFEQPAE